MVVPLIQSPADQMLVAPLQVLRVTHLWLFDAEFAVGLPSQVDDPRALLLASVAGGSALRRTAGWSGPARLDDAVEAACAALARRLGVARGGPRARTAARGPRSPDARRPQRVTSIDAGRHGVTITVRGTVETVLPCCTQYLDDQGRAVPLTRDARLAVRRALARHAAQGRRVLAVAHRAVGVGRPAPADRQEAETDLVLIGLVALADPAADHLTRPSLPAAPAARTW